MVDFLVDNWVYLLFLLVSAINSTISFLAYLKTGKLSNISIIDKNNDGVVDEDIRKLIEYHEKVAQELKEKIQKK